MQIAKYTLLACIILMSANCQTRIKEAKDVALSTVKPVEKVVYTAEQLTEYETAYFASGCFWCVEAIFESVKGVKEVVSGYSGGPEKDPTYQQVAYGLTGHAEAVEVYYNPKEISFTKLVQVFFGSHDPTTLNRQGPDYGKHYRSIAFYKNKKEEKIITDYRDLLQSRGLYDRPIVTEITAFEKFYKAEDYHQDYERNNPNNSYILKVSLPRLNRFKENFPEYLKKESH